MDFTLIGLALLLCSGYLNRSGATQLTESSGHNVVTMTITIQTEISIQSRKIQLSDLYADVLLIILRQMELNELLRMGATSMKFFYLVIYVLRVEYPDFQINIMYAEIGQTVKFTVDFVGKTLEIYDYKMSLRLLKYFGLIFRRLKIDNREIEFNQSAIINQYANEYTSEFLTHLNLGDVKTDTLSQFTVPFKLVEDFSCLIGLREIQMNIMRFDRLFPKLRRLSLILNSNLDYSFIDCRLPNLKYLDISVSTNGWKRKKQIEGLIRKNPQLESIELDVDPAHYIKDVNTFLPNLKNVTLHRFDIGNDSLHFEHVKRFILCTSDHGSIVNLSFAGLESLQAQYSTEFQDEWHDFFQRHNNLSVLHLYEYRTMQSIHLTELTRNLTNLIEMKVQYNDAINVTDIVNFLRTHPRLRTFQLSTKLYREPEFIALRERLRWDWHIQESSTFWPGLLFKRKNPLI